MATNRKPHEGKVAVITGSTYGIGYSIARRLAQDGASVMICSRSQENVDKAVAKLKADGLTVCGTVCDVFKEADWKSLIDQTVVKYGGVDILVSNAGGAIPNAGWGPMMDATEETWDAAFQFNLKSGFFLAKAAFENMKSRGGGNIIFVASIVAYQACAGCELLPNIGLYSVTKTAMVGLIQAMAPQCAEEGVRVNGIAPGFVATPLTSELRKMPKVADDYINRCPMRRIGQPEDMAGTVSFLCSEDASYITGEVVTIAGGFPTRL